jgi:hypothetical protein
MQSHYGSLQHVTTKMLFFIIGQDAMCHLKKLYHIGALDIDRVFINKMTRLLM